MFKCFTQLRIQNHKNVFQLKPRNLEIAYGVYAIVRVIVCIYTSARILFVSRVRSEVSCSQLHVAVQSVGLLDDDYSSLEKMEVFLSKED